MADVLCTVPAGPARAAAVLIEEAEAPMPDDATPDDDPPDGSPPPGGTLAGDDLAALGLRPVELADGPTFARYFATLADPLSDYTFAQIYSWRNSLHLAWRECRGHLCVFANGCGDLTLLVPPIGDTGADAALGDAAELMDAYNAAAGVPDRTRVEYASDELLARLDPARLSAVTPMGNDYVYDTARMIDLAGGDLASKRQAKNRFTRTYAHRVEPYDPARHLDGCLALLHRWHAHQDATHAAEPTTTAVKRAKESTATELALRAAPQLGLTGMVVHVADKAGFESVGGFTFGEPLGRDQSSIVIEKTDLATKGLAQFIFSDFCRRHWADRPWCNVGDDWGLPSLAWTKASYRPVRQIRKWAMTPARRTMMAPRPAVVLRPGTDADIPPAAALESACFSQQLSLRPRQLRYLHRRGTAVWLVAECNGQLAGHIVAGVRPGGPVPSARVFTLAVDAAHRGRGVGRRLLAGLTDALATRGVGRVVLEVDRTNRPAVALYERCGFAPTATLADYYGDGVDALLMARELTPIPTALAA